MDALSLIPAPVARRHRQVRRQAGLIALVVALAGTLTPIAWALLPLAAAQAWRVRAERAAVLASVIWVVVGVAIIDPRAVTAYSPMLTGPWVTLLTAAMATLAAWAISQRREGGALLRAAALLAIAASPWSPLPALLIALGCRLAAPVRAYPSAANDNHAGSRALVTPASMPYPPRRVVGVAACD
ncbi:hypothetical protein KZ810_06655 [Sphingomonas sp. RHCKR47]|uniref:hypothetical protein n=1 Tax=Sphingomonas citricola TaxID=2862498 RepID=UPI001CA53A01|nr:hypothetical protein [Sphingomonas citricola]MBW6523175.1 hypothetical protein [Sphingomonas citricola]